MLCKPCHVLWPGTRVLKAGKHGWVAALKGINEHQRNGIVVQLRTRWAIVLHPETNKWNKNSKAVIKAEVCLHEPCVGRTQPGDSDDSSNSNHKQLKTNYQLTGC